MKTLFLIICLLLIQNCVTVDDMEDRDLGPKTYWGAADEEDDNPFIGKR